MSTSCSEILSEVRARISRGNLADLPSYCIKALGANDVETAWIKAIELARSSGEYVLLKYMSYVDVLLRRAHLMSAEEVEFMSRDLLICLEKLCRLTEGSPGKLH